MYPDIIPVDRNEKYEKSSKVFLGKQFLWKSFFLPAFIAVPSIHFFGRLYH
jgi:hypothetical protein